MMTEAIYKVGDILELDGNASFLRQFGMFPKDVKIRCLVLKCIKPGYEFVIYTLLVYKIDGSFDTIGANQKDIILAAKRVGHIDISSFLSGEESAELDYAMFFTAATIAQAADLRNELDKIKKENEELKAERDKANHEIDRLRTVIGGLNGIIDDLNTSKSEISDLFCSLKNALQTNDILEGVNQLKKENERFRISNKALSESLSNSEMKAHSRLNEISFLTRKVNELESANNDLKAELDEKTEELKKVRSSDWACELKRLVEGNEKLRAENARYLQSMTCAEKQLTEAAKRIYEAREHMDVALYSN